MARPITKNQFSDLWVNEFCTEAGFCSLCGNSGTIDTRGKVFTPSGIECGSKNWCICPNGRILKKQSGMKCH